MITNLLRVSGCSLLLLNPFVIGSNDFNSKNEVDKKEDSLVYWDANIGYSWAINNNDTTILEYQYNYENKRILINFHLETSEPRKYFVNEDTLSLEVARDYIINFKIFHTSQDSIGVIDLSHRFGESVDTIWYQKSIDQSTYPVKGILLNPDKSTWPIRAIYKKTKDGKG